MRRKQQARGWVTELLLKERLDVDLLQAAGIVTDAAAYTKRVVKINTALLYASAPSAQASRAAGSHGASGAHAPALA